MEKSKTILAVLLLIVMGSILGFQVRKIKASPTPIKYVRTEGVFQYLSKDEIKKTLLPLVKTDFFTADMLAIKQAVGQLPWVEKVSVKRVWPDAIDIRVAEKIPLVRWGEKSLLSVRGELFSPVNVAQFKDLPLLYGPAGQEKKVLEIMRGIQTTLSDQSMDLAEFTINERRSWKLKLTNGMEIQLGRKDQLKNFQKFLKTLALLGQKNIDINSIARVDLRYPNGYAVSWKPDAAPIDWKKLAEQQQS